MKKAVTVAHAAHTYYQSGIHKDLRFGQYYIVRYMPEDTVWPELWYETDLVKACEMVNARFFM